MNLQRERIATGFPHKIYSLAITGALPLISLGLLASKRGRRRLAERYGVWQDVGEVEWWLHGASVGEVNGLMPLVDALRKVSPTGRMLLSSTSPTGLDRAGGAVEAKRLAPIDAPLTTLNAVRHVSAQSFIVTETELWPNLLCAVAQSGASMHLVNGRISDYTLRRYQLLSSVFRPLLQRFESVCVADQEQRERFLALGVDPAKLSVTGHTKYHLAPKYELNAAEREAARGEFFGQLDSDTKVLTLGSIRHGEEQVWIPALERLFREGRRCRVIVAPRHAERFDYFFNAFNRHTWSIARWSDGRAKASADLVLLDTMGLLERAYLAADLAFIGATLTDIGGHNPLEPAMYGVPVAVGPYTSVIREPLAALRAAGGALDIRSVDDAYGLLVKLCDGDSQLCSSGAMALKAQRELSGACNLVVQAIQSARGRG